MDFLKIEGRERLISLLEKYFENWNFIIGSIDDDGGNDQSEITVIDRNHVVSDLCHSAPILILLEEFDSDRRLFFLRK